MTAREDKARRVAKARDQLWHSVFAYLAETEDEARAKEVPFANFAAMVEAGVDRIDDLAERMNEGWTVGRAGGWTVGRAGGAS